MTSSLPLVWAIGVPPAALRTLVDIGAEIVATDGVSQLPSSSSPLTLIVTAARNVAIVRAATPPVASTPLLALLDDADDALAAAHAGADWVLTDDVDPPLLDAVFTAAQRVAQERMLSRAAMAGLELAGPGGGGAPIALEAAVVEHVGASVTSVIGWELGYRTMIETALDAILIADSDTSHLLEMNPAARRMFGYDDAEAGKVTLRMLAADDAQEIVERVMSSLAETGAALEHRYPMQRNDGSRFWATFHGTSYEHAGRRHTMAVIRDISEHVLREQTLERTNRQLEEMQKQLFHSGRLAALGQMAAGVAHEINNPLQYVLGGLEELGDALVDSPEDVKRAYSDMCEGVERIRLVTRSLLPFSSVDGAASELVDLVEVVEWACRANTSETTRRARLDLQLAPVPGILAERGRIRQLVTNLLTNAAHAIPEGAADRNVITISTSVVNDRVHLCVNDTGSGIPESVRGRIFDPFFTTKARDVGTGLGLSLCAEIVASTGGTIGFDSTVGVGTRFVVTFEPARHAPTPLEPVVAPLARARILVVDDEEPLLRTFGRFLKDCDVITALGGARAIELVDTAPPFDVIVCDLMMPGVDGLAVYQHVTRQAPELAAGMIFCTGGAYTDRVQTFVEGLSNVVLDKPVPWRRLVEAVGIAVARARRGRSGRVIPR